MELRAYLVSSPQQLVPAPRSRPWMEETPDHFAHRCLPLLMSNSGGWLLLNTVPFRATWDGGHLATSITIEALEPERDACALSTFGCGILTFHVSFLFRTPRGYNLLVRGQPNNPKDGISPLEGLVETDSDVVATFTMNWKFTRPGSVTFEKDEPFCMIVPQKRHELEEWTVRTYAAGADLELQRKYQGWSESRRSFNAALARGDAQAHAQKWQKEYVRGAQQTKRKLSDGKSRTSWIHTVFSVDGNHPYLGWQAELLAYSWHDVQPGQLTRIFSADEPMTPFQMGTTFQTPSYALRNGDSYPPRNRVYGLRDWLDAGLPEEESILLLDPDFVFVREVSREPTPGRPIGQAMRYMDPFGQRELLRRHGFQPEHVQGVGVPIFIHREDLRSLIPWWIHYMEAIRSDPVSRDLLGGTAWIAEMWGYCLAAAKVGVWHEMEALVQFSSENRDDLPLIHYCYDSQSRDGTWSWSKRSYCAWGRVADPPADTPQATVALIHLLNECNAYLHEP